MSSAPCDPSRAAALLAWYAACGRDLPWRRTREPYAVWVSEIMLQQTRVETVLPRYAAWFERFADISALAAADIDTVLKTWEGLGYYRRARLLHAAAQRIVERHGGCFPAAFDDILALPGIGRSTAGAIASFCFGATTPVLDGNVRRVLRRWHGAPAATDRRLWTWAEEAIATSGDPAAWNQAMMELGATRCAPRTPDCAACPARTRCDSAFAVDDAPATRRRVPVRDLHWRIDLHLDAERGIWLTRRPARGIWAGLWTPPITELPEPPAARPCYVHLLTHRRLHLYGRPTAKRPGRDGRWVTDPGEVALPVGIRRLLQKHGVCR